MRLLGQLGGAGMELEEPLVLGAAELGKTLAIDHGRNLVGRPCGGPSCVRTQCGAWTTPCLPLHPRQKYTEDGQRMREVLSYSRRGGRFTPSQQESWDAHHRDWVVPDDAVDDPAFSWSDDFGRTAPLIVEIGSGVGEATAVLAAQRPSYDIVALEVWRPGVAHTLGLLAEAGAENVRLLSVDAVWCLEHTFGPGEVEELWTFFPTRGPSSATTSGDWSPRSSPPSRARACGPAGCGDWPPTGGSTPSRCAPCSTRSRPWRAGRSSAGRTVRHEVRAQGRQRRPSDRRPHLPQDLIAQHGAARSGLPDVPVETRPAPGRAPGGGARPRGRTPRGSSASVVGTSRARRC